MAVRAGIALLCSRVQADDRGQMTVELLVVLPVVLIVAVVAVNALTFFGDCAAFDRVARNAVRLCAASPAYGQDAGRGAEEVRAVIEEALVRDNLAVCSGMSPTRPRWPMPRPCSGWGCVTRCSACGFRVWSIGCR